MLRKVFYSLFGVFMATITPSILQSEIIVSDKIESVLPLIDKDTLVLFNASDVMYQHTSVLADVTFREHFAQRTKQIEMKKLQTKSSIKFEEF